MKKIKLLTSHFTFFIFLLLNNQCYMHYSSLVNAPQIEISNSNNKPLKLKQSLPLKIELNSKYRYSFDPKKIYRKNYIDGSSENKVEHFSNDDVIDNFFSSELLAKFRYDSDINLNSNATIKINIIPQFEGFEKPVLSAGSALWTGFILPWTTTSYGKIEFQLIDVYTGDVLKSYMYEIKNQQMLGWSSIIIGPILPIFSERFDHSMNEKSFAVSRLAYNTFKKDLLVDLSNDKNFENRYYKLVSPIYEIKSFSSQENEISKLSTLLLNEIKSNFSERGLIFQDLNNLSKESNTQNTLIADRILFISSFILRRDLNNRISHIQGSVICKSKKLGHVLWEQEIDFYNNNDLLEEDIIKNIVNELNAELRLRGEI
jgi:hypothetical protein